MQLLTPPTHISPLGALIAAFTLAACSPSPASSPTPSAGDGCDGEIAIIWNNAKGSENELVSCADGKPAVARWESYPDTKEDRQSTALDRAKWDEAWAALETADWSAKCGSDGPTTVLRVTRNGTSHELACSAELPAWFKKVVDATRAPSSGAATSHASTGPDAQEVLAMVRASTIELAVQPKTTLGAHATAAFAKAKSPPEVRCEATDATHYHCTVSSPGSGFGYALNLVHDKGWTIAPGAEVMPDD